mgnify:FL=1
MRYNNSPGIQGARAELLSIGVDGGVDKAADGVKRAEAIKDKWL